MQKINGDQLFDEMLEAKWFDKKKPPRWMVLDREFIVPTEAQVLEVMHKDHTERIKYIAESGDCDNFAFDLRHAYGRKGWSVGVLIVKIPEGLHAIFFSRTKDGGLKSYEPQSDKELGTPDVVGVIMY